MIAAPASKPATTDLNNLMQALEIDVVALELNTAPQGISPIRRVLAEFAGWRQKTENG